MSVKRRNTSVYSCFPKSKSVSPVLSTTPFISDSGIPSLDNAVRRTSLPRPRVAMIAASLDIVGGQEVQAKILCEKLRSEGYAVRFIPINPAFPRRIERLREWRYL